MKDVSERLRLAVQYILDKGYERSEAAIARRLGVLPSVLNMAKTGDREPKWGMLLDFCDNYPVNFWWLRTGEGEMISGHVSRELALLKKIERLEARIRELEGKD